MTNLRLLEYSKDLIKKAKISEKKFPQNIRPHFRHEMCVIWTDEGEINDLCKDCQFCGLSDFSRKAFELGMHGQMHTDGDGLKPMTYRANSGVTLRVPFTDILQKGKRWVCHNPEAGGKKGIYILDGNVPPCEFKIVKKTEKK